MKRKFIIVAVLIAFVVLALPLSTSAQGVPTLPAYCYGELKFNGQPAPIGSVVVAKVDGVERGSLETFYEGWHGRPGLESKLLVSGSGLSGKMVRFYVSGQGFSDLFAGEVLYWGSGEGLRVDLSLQVEGTPDPGSYTLNVSVVGQGTTVPAVGSHTYSSGTQVALQATAQSGWVFEKWVVGSATVTSAATTTVMNANKSATAYFTQVGTTPPPSDPSTPPPSQPDPDGSSPTPAPPAGEDGIRPGDISGSGTIDVNDVRLALQYVLEMRTLTEDQKKAADVNNDGKVDVRDVTLIMQYALGLITSF
jgi:hypothetical protein